jgi:hypothetical protein
MQTNEAWDLNDTSGQCTQLGSVGIHKGRSGPHLSQYFISLHYLQPSAVCLFSLSPSVSSAKVGYTCSRRHT